MLIRYNVKEDDRQVVKVTNAEIRFEGSVGMLIPYITLARKKLSAMLEEAKGASRRKTLDLGNVKIKLAVERGTGKAVLAGGGSIEAVYVVTYAVNPTDWPPITYDGGMYNLYSLNEAWYKPAEGNLEGVGGRLFYRDTAEWIMDNLLLVNGKWAFTTTTWIEGSPPDPVVIKGVDKVNRYRIPKGKRSVGNDLLKTEYKYTADFSGYYIRFMLPKHFINVMKMPPASGARYKVDRHRVDTGAFVDTTYIPLASQTFSLTTGFHAKAAEDDGTLYEDTYYSGGSDRFIRIDAAGGVANDYFDDEAMSLGFAPLANLVIMHDSYTRVIVRGDYVLITHKKNGVVTLAGETDFTWNPYYRIFVLDKVTLEMVATIPSDGITGSILDAEYLKLKKDKPWSIKYIAQIIKGYSRISGVVRANVEHYENKLVFDGVSTISVKRLRKLLNTIAIEMPASEAGPAIYSAGYLLQYDKSSGGSL